MGRISQSCSSRRASSLTALSMFQSALVVELSRRLALLSRRPSSYQSFIEGDQARLARLLELVDLEDASLGNAGEVLDCVDQLQLGSRGFSSRGFRGWHVGASSAVVQVRQSQSRRHSLPVCRVFGRSIARWFDEPR